MHEQAHTFFVSIWLHAMIVSPEAATRLGWTMLTLRGLYPITWALEGDHPTIRGPGSICVFCVAMPMIAISIYLLAMSAAVLNDVDLRAKLLSDISTGDENIGTTAVLRRIHLDTTAHCHTFLHTQKHCKFLKLSSNVETTIPSQARGQEVLAIEL